MARDSRVSNPPVAAAADAVKNVNSNGGHSDPSCSASVYQSFRPVTRSMTHVSPDLKGQGSTSTNTRQSTVDASFSIQSAALRPIVTRARTPHKVTTSAWKPLTQPVALSEGQKCESFTTMNPNAKFSRAAPTRVAKDSDHSASKANSIVLSGKRNRYEEITSQGEQPDAAVMPSPTKKLQTCKFPSDTFSKGLSSIRILGGKVPAPLPTGKSQTETGNNPASVLAKPVSASANVISLSADAAVSLPAQQLQPETAKNCSVITESVNKETSRIQQLSAKFANLPRQKLETGYQEMPSSVPMMKNQVSGLSGATAPMALPKLQIGNMKDTSNVFPNHAYVRAMLIKQQQQLLQQYNLVSSQQQQQELYIKGPALPWSDETPPIEPLGTRCELCKLDVAFHQQGNAGRDASAPPVVAILACHHAFHSSCIEGVYGLVEPSQCIACVEAGMDH